jgi:hypothetical protein
MMVLPDITVDSPLRTHVKRDLPQSLASTYPHGHISGHPRSPPSQRAFEARKATILRTMTAEQIETAYQETVKKVTVILDEDRKKNEEIDREVEKLRKQRETERKVFRKMREDFDKKNGKDDVMQVKEEGDG